MASVVFIIFAIYPFQFNLNYSFATSRTDREQLGNREVFGVRDMTRNHITSNDPSTTLRAVVLPNQLPSTSNPSATSSAINPHLDAPSIRNTGSVSTPCLAVSSVGDLFPAFPRQRCAFLLSVTKTQR